MYTVMLILSYSITTSECFYHCMTSDMTRQPCDF